MSELVVASSAQVARRLSPICQPGYRAGLKPPNWQKRYVKEDIDGS